MFVIKRKGNKQKFEIDKIEKRLLYLCNFREKKIKVNLKNILKEIKDDIYQNIKTYEIDNYLSKLCIMYSIKNYNYGILASRIIINNHHKNTLNSFEDKMNLLYMASLINDKFYKFVKCNKTKLEKMISYDKDYLMDFFGFKTLEKNYLLKIKNKIIERPQDLLLRVSIAIHFNEEDYDDVESLNKIKETYDYLSDKKFIHATPTNFNAGTNKQALSSCFLLGTEDSLEGIMETATRCAKISKWGGGIGLHCSNWRSKGSMIKSINGKSGGIIPFIQILDKIARGFNQCVGPHTYIKTIKGKKKIKNIKINEKVLTNDGKYNKVMNIKKKEINEKLIKYKPEHSLFKLSCTNDHEILILKTNNNELTKKNIAKKIKLGLIKEKYIEAKNIEKGDYAVFPKIKYEKDNINIDQDDCLFLGAFLSSGEINIIKIKTKKIINYTIVINATNIILIKFIKTYLKKNNVKYFSIKKKYEIITWENNNLGGLIHKKIIYNNKKKYINVKYKNLPKKKIYKILEGFIKTRSFFHKNELLYYTNNIEMIFDLFDLFYRLDILVKFKYHLINKNRKSIYIIIPFDKKLKFLEEFNIKFTKKSYIETENNLYSEIILVDRTEYKGNVYDLTIDKKHNYLTYNGIVHNCGKRAGSIAIYLEPHHPDIFSFLELKKNHGDENLRARDLFYGLWISDLFMKRVEEDKDWSLFDPDECPNLNNVYGKEYEKLYKKYEKENKQKNKVKARYLWKLIWLSQKETGLPYILYKDSCNRSSNQQNLGIIKSSNLCTEIIEFSSSTEIASCNLCSICLPKFVKDKYSEDDNEKKRELDHEYPLNPYFDFNEFVKVIKIAVNNLNQIIDKNFYPLPEIAISNFKHRPIGIGVQGLADVFYKFKIPFDSDNAKKLNKLIFETLYFAALSESSLLAKKQHINNKKKIKKNNKNKIIVDYKIIGNVLTPIYNTYNSANEIPKKSGAYLSFSGSPLSKGVFHWELYDKSDEIKLSNMWDWEGLKKHIKIYGTRNSLLIALMPTASTSQIMGNTEGCEALTSNIYKRKTLAGEFIVINKYLMNNLKKLNLWNDEVELHLKINNGSIQGIEKIPQYIKNIYKTVWEIKQKKIIDMAHDRQMFVDQSQSMNIFMEEFSLSKFNGLNFYTWRKGLKTGCYYLRTRPKLNPQKFTIDYKLEKKIISNKKNNNIEKLKNKNNNINFNIEEIKEGCLLCSS